MAIDSNIRDHKTWIGYLQPEGLVVSPAALVDAQVSLDLGGAAVRQRDLEQYVRPRVSVTTIQFPKHSKSRFETSAKPCSPLTPSPPVSSQPKTIPTHHRGYCWSKSWNRARRSTSQSNRSYPVGPHHRPDGSSDCFASPASRSACCPTAPGCSSSTHREERMPAG